MSRRPIDQSGVEARPLPEPVADTLPDATFTLQGGHLHCSAHGTMALITTSRGMASTSARWACPGCPVDVELTQARL